MAKYGKNNYFDGVILPEPKEEMLRRMAKGVDCTKGYLGSTDAGLLFDGPRTLECFFKYISSDKMQVIAGFGIFMLEIQILTTNQLRVYCGGGNATVDIIPGNSYLVDVAYDGTTAICYLNGTEAARFPVTGYKAMDSFRTGSNTYIPQGSLVFCRHYNYALSAEEVVALYNNGDPMGYVVPKAMRGLEPVEITGSNSYTWTGVDSVANVGIRTNPNIEYGKFYVVNISVSDYEAGSPYLYIGYPYGIPKVNGNYNILIEHQHQSSNTILLFGGPDGTDRRLTLTVNSVTPVGLLAEYLPQNLIPTAEGSVVKWLDSAPQLPEANGILPPLDASVGGYDLAAIGNPKIII